MQNRMLICDVSSITKSFGAEDRDAVDSGYELKGSVSEVDEYVHLFGACNIIIGVSPDVQSYLQVAGPKDDPIVDIFLYIAPEEKSQLDQIFLGAPFDACLITLKYYSDVALVDHYLANSVSVMGYDFSFERKIRK